MSIHLNRIQTAKDVASIEHEGRSFRLLEHRHKSSVTARTIVVSGGSHTPRVDAAGYRGAAERTFDIDPIVVRKETAADRFGKKLGLNVEALIGDGAIDDAYYFETDTAREVVRDLFSDPALRAALVEALGHADAVIIGPPGGVVAGMKDGGGLTLKDEDRLRALARLAGALPAIRARPPKSPFAQVAPMIVTSLAIQIGVGVGVVWTHGCRPLLGAVVALPMLLGVVAAAVLAFTVLLLAFRGRANGFRPWIMSSGFLVVGVNGAAVGLYNDLNERLDHVAPKQYEATVVAYRPYKKKKQDGLLQVKGLPSSLVTPTGANGAQEIAYSLMPDPTCKKLELRVAPGYFGNPWVSAVRCMAR